MANDLDWIYGAHCATWKSSSSDKANSRHTNYVGHVQDLRAATGNYYIPAYNSIERGAYITDAQGNFIQDESFNWTARGSQANNEVETFSAQIDFAPLDWLEGKYVFTHDNSRYDSI